MIETRNGERVSEIALSCGKWCYFVSENGVRYIVTNARGKLIVTKPLSTRRLNPTLEMLAVFASKISARQPGQ